MNHLRLLKKSLLFPFWFCDPSLFRVQSIGKINLPKRNILFPLFIVLLGVSLLMGCATVGPNYISPKVSMPKEWSTPLKEDMKAESSDALVTWWTTLKDPELTSLIERASKNNLDLQKAKEHIYEERAQRGVTNASRFPTITSKGSASRQHSSNGSGGGTESDLYDASFDASWELDLFGGVRRSIESAQANLEQSIEDFRDTQVTLFAEVAVNYIELRTYQTRLTIAEMNLKSQTETYDIAQWRFQAGLATQLDIEQAKYNMEQTKSNIPALRIGIEKAINRLSVLLGQTPGSLKEELNERKNIPVPPLEIAVGVPAEILSRRPDVRSAEKNLASKTADIGIATADLYPKFTLSGSIGLESLSISKLLSWGNRTYGIGPSVSWTLFDFGSIRKNIEVKNALQKQALIQYESSVLTALEEVENGLVTYAEEQETRNSLLEAEQAAQRAVDLAQKQYVSGLIDFETVMETQRTQLTLQDQLVDTEGSVTTNLIKLYKALGGGWTSMESVNENSNKEIKNEFKQHKT